MHLVEADVRDNQRRLHLVVVGVVARDSIVKDDHRPWRLWVAVLMMDVPHFVVARLTLRGFLALHCCLVERRPDEPHYSFCVFAEPW